MQFAHDRCRNYNNFALNEPSVVTHCFHVEILWNLFLIPACLFIRYHDQISLGLKTFEFFISLILIIFLLKQILKNEFFW